MPKVKSITIFEGGFELWENLKQSTYTHCRLFNIHSKKYERTTDNSKRSRNRTMDNYGKKAYEWASPEELNKVYENEKAKIQKILNDIQEKAKTVGIESKTEILMIPRTEGTVKPVLKYAEDEEIDLIVVGTRGRTGIKMMLLGSVASGVVTYAHCPVIVVK